MAAALFCQRPTGLAAPAAPPLDAPAGAGQYNDAKHHVSLQYPATWKTKADADFDLRLVPIDGGANCTITFDAPDVPSVPLFGIPMGLVESHYIDDQKSKHPGLNVDATSDYSLAGAKKARLVQMSWKRDGVGHGGFSLLIVHGDDVLILAGDADADRFTATRAAFDKIAASIQWGK